MLFKEKLVTYIDTKITSWQQAIQIANQLLINNHYIDDNFSKELIELTNKLGPYYIIAPQIALLHLTPKEEWKNKNNAISLTVFKEPVVFKDDMKYHVKYCLSLFAKDNYSHIDLLEKFANLFSNKDFLNELEKVKNTQDILLVLQKYDK
ncbi:PTS sugar transporter subunit IIA [Mycoplasma mycoides]|uniref:PTS IIA component n=1 Tax=Mycoplasma mycoides subsp. capri TaxID=40477 RepID=A0AB38GDN9_MYCMC|nr:PTS sugar transporter subunit IIA [Mycoplasma mycoides]ADH21842.1 PTS system, IIA component [synthetic Mycoplasma mycoides JCVI-syn1.0]AMW76899.1 phosphoenolpyruvate-dependent sugar PTS family porter, EIIA 2 component [synthetic bacterium JCVI-Syn2.0]ACU78345.1 PTS system, IIA component [Mycoplasma mycoides subsp. capri str. GM12]ACU79174.1 PTS system, IIA component [Mycoplasma mycoides subsp. capri str. GM12]SRX58723.1 PTS IIA component [Mycoplasma mycoides subsp. capri]